MVFNEIVNQAANPLKKGKKLKFKFKKKIMSSGAVELQSYLF
jgi:hypothetical protein